MTLSIDNAREVYFSKISREEAIQIWNSGREKRGIYILHSDLTDSLAEYVSEIETTEEEIGLEHPYEEMSDRRKDFYELLYTDLAEVKSLNTLSLVKENIGRIMTLIDYVEGLGFEC